MAIKDPDIREHNNPKLAEVDSNFVRGGGRVVTNLTALYALSDNIDQLKERVTKVWVTSENKNYILKNISDISDGLFNPSAWEIEAVNEKMTESEFVGVSGTKSVNRAVSSQYAGQANADILGRTIHETYALKQSGVTPPEIFRVMLDDTTPTYTIEALTAENLIVENIATTGGEVIAPILVADKTLKITIQGNDTLLNGNTYEDGVTVFGIYEASAEAWTFSSILDPEVPDYSDMTVDVMLENPTVITSMGNGIVVAQFIHLNKYVFIRTHATAIGIYRCIALYNSGNAYLEPIAAGTALHTVRVKDGDVWYSQYDGENAGTLVFEAFDNKVDKNGTDRLITSEEAFLLENMSPIEFEVTDVINGIIIPESPTKLYRISTATDLTVTINTGLLDLTKYIKLFVKINLNDYVVLTFPENWYFANLAIPTEVGEYLYEVSSSDGGDTWRAALRYKNIATVGIDQEGNEIVGAKTLFVDGEKADNSGDGLTWLTAKKDVQAAIDIANTGDAVFVKGKIGGLKYLPTTERTPGTLQSKSFIMKAGVNVYGGFKGIESTLYEREMVSYPQTMTLPTGTFTMYVDIPKYQSILSGDLNSENMISGTVTNGIRLTNTSNNATIVVYSLGSVTINGFNIIGGVSSSTTLGRGHGVLSSGRMTKVRNCLIEDCGTLWSGVNVNIAYGGGATSADLSTCIIRNCSAICNGGSNGGAHGPACYDSSINNSIVMFNYCVGGGGGTVYGSHGSAVSSSVAQNVYAGSNLAIAGGTIRITGAFSESTCSNCVSENNSATGSAPQGGGYTNSTVTNSVSKNNNATNGAGAFGCTLINCSILNNTATTGGGAYGGTLINCSILNNTATTGGGAFSGTLINCSVIRNKCITDAAGTSNAILKNTVVYGNKHTSGVKMNVVNTNSSEETYSAFEDEVRVGTGNISLSVNNEGDATSPYFQSLSTDAGVVDEIYVSNPKIRNSSFLIDKGLNSLNESGYGALYDLSSLNRKVGTIDIGAYENQKTV